MLSKEGGRKSLAHLSMGEVLANLCMGEVLASMFVLLETVLLM